MSGTLRAADGTTEGRPGHGRAPMTARTLEATRPVDSAAREGRSHQACPAEGHRVEGVDPRHRSPGTTWDS
ncbi:hypothetical protein AMK21_09710 [Streptomyces sp. CB00316]|nr:hypothetical protein AMK21_09710 [Streptomyces sp. CB00316]